MRKILFFILSVMILAACTAFMLNAYMRSSCSDLGDFAGATTGDTTRLVASDVVSEPPSSTSSETLSETSTEITSEISSETSSGISSEISTMTSSETSSVTSSEAATSNALVSGTSSSEDPWVKESEELLASFDRNALSRWTKESDISDEWKSYFAMDNRFVLTFKNYDYLMSLAPSVKRFGVYVEDMKTGKTFTINGDEDFYAASTRKLAICTMGLRLVQDKKMRLDDYVIYNPEWDDEPGASVIQVHSRKGDVFQILTLIDYIGRYSDNIALNMLVRKIIVSGGYEEYKHQMTILTGREFVPENVYTPRQLAHSVKALCVSVAQDPIFEALVYPLEEVTYNEYVTKNMPKGSYFHKSGLFYGENINYTNDIGVIYGKNPLIFSVMTEWNGGEWDLPYPLLHEIGKYLRYIAETGDFPDQAGTVR